jgi:hypothetical protein
MSNGRVEFTNPDSWSKRLIKAVGPEQSPVQGQFSIDVGNQIKIIVTEGNPTSVDIQRPGQANERIWYYKRETSLVSEAKFKSVFGAH